MKFGNMAAFAVGPVFAALLSLATLPFVAWFFSTQDVARLSLAQIVLGLCISIFSLQMHQSYVREYHEELNKKVLLKTAAFPGFIFLLFALIIVFFIPFSISYLLFEINSSTLTILLCGSVIAAFFSNLLSHVIRMEERGWAFSISQILAKGLIFLFIPIAIIFKASNNFHYLMLMNTLSIVLTCVVMGWLTRQSWVSLFSEKIDIGLLTRMLKFSIPLIAGGLAYWALTGVDRFFLKKFSGLNDLGIYAMSTSIASSAMMCSIIFSNIWHPTVYKWIKEGIDEEKLSIVIEGVLLFIAFVWSLFGIFSWVFPIFLPKDYASLNYIVVACAAAPLMYMLSETTMIGIGISRKSEYALAASLFSLILNVALNYLFTPKYGVVAVSLISAVSFFIFFCIRTEASAYLWKSFPRRKVYFSVIIYMLFTAHFTITKGSHNIGGSLVWLIPLFLTIFIFRERFIFFIEMLRKKN